MSRYSDTVMCKSCHHKLNPSHKELDTLPVTESGHTATFPYSNKKKIYCYECAKFCDAPNYIVVIK